MDFFAVIELRWRCYAEFGMILSWSETIIMAETEIVLAKIRLLSDVK